MGRIVNNHLSGLRDEEGSGKQVGRYFGEDVQEQRQHGEVNLKGRTGNDNIFEVYDSGRQVA